MLFYKLTGDSGATILQNEIGVLLLYWRAKAIMVVLGSDVHEATLNIYISRNLDNPALLYCVQEQKIHKLHKVFSIRFEE